MAHLVYTRRLFLANMAPARMIGQQQILVPIACRVWNGIYKTKTVLESDFSQTSLKVGVGYNFFSGRMCGWGSSALP